MTGKTIGTALAACCLFWGIAAAERAVAEPVSRNGSRAGSVIARKAGEEVRFIELPAWRLVDLSQDLLPGDVLRTNANGQLAVLFADKTQIRLGRNTALRVKAIGGGADTALDLQSGTIWARAERGGTGVTVETPAAAAAIRGTDWSVSVDAGGKTTLIVLEGLVELSNPYGSVRVAQGEAAVASIGQAPTKIVIVNPKDREQMLFYLSLRGAFTFLPASPLATPDMRGRRAAILARPESARTAEDWLTLAEVGLSYDGREAARAALARIEGRRLDRRQAARRDLVEALIAGAEKHFVDASRLFERAGPGLDARRRAIAAYGGYYARALADPDRVEAPPRIEGGGPYGAIAEALTAGFLKDIPAALAVIRRAEARFPGDPTLPATRAQLALLIDDRAEVEAAIARALALDPENAQALEARANYAAGIRSDLKGALADLEKAADIAPGSTSIWNDLGLVHSARGDHRKAEAAFQRSIELDPEDPVSHANLAILYLDQNRVEAARREIDIALAADPSFSVGRVARGRYRLQTGDLDGALEDLLVGTTDNPAYSQGLLLLAAAYYERGEDEPGAQALDNADRLDPNDPVASSFRTTVAIDQYRSNDAIRSAQEFLRRGRARGGDFASLDANQDAGSTLNSAFRLQGLDAWGRYYGEAVFQPFSASGYFDQAVGGSVNPFANAIAPGGNAAVPSANLSSFSSLFQGLLLDPATLSGRTLTPNIIRRPFIEGSIGGGIVSGDGADDWTGEAELQAAANAPFPISLYGHLERNATVGTRPTPGTPGSLGIDVENEQWTGTGILGAAPGPDDHLVAYANVANQSDTLTAIPDPAVFPLGATSTDESDVTATSAGVAWSHSFGYRNVANVAFFLNDITGDSTRRRLLETGVGPFGITETDVNNQRSMVAAASHAIELGNVTLRSGIEGGSLSIDQTQTQTLLIPFLPPTSATAGGATDFGIGRAYADATYRASPNLLFEAGAFGTLIDGTTQNETRFEPRLGVAFEPLEGQWLRAGFLREGLAFGIPTLSPVGVAGLQSNQSSLDYDGYADTFAARWDAEWSRNFFTSVDYQHQELNEVSIAIPASVTTVDLAEGRIDRTSATANLLLGYGFGAFATIAHADSENRDPASAGFGQGLPFVPETAAQVGLTFVSPANLRVTVAGNYVGERAGDVAGTRLDDYWTLDANLVFEPFDKRFALDLAAYNLLDEDFDVATGTPGWGRNFVGRLKVRF